MRCVKPSSAMRVAVVHEQRDRLGQREQLGHLGRELPCAGSRRARRRLRPGIGLAETGGWTCARADEPEPRCVFVSHPVLLEGWQTPIAPQRMFTVSNCQDTVLLFGTRCRPIPHPPAPGATTAFRNRSSAASRSCRRSGRAAAPRQQRARARDRPHPQHGAPLRRLARHARLPPAGRPRASTGSGPACSTSASRPSTRWRSARSRLPTCSS